ncbi:NnrS family protein [Ferruginivarius sediminum]|uniref:NnrS family protein n=1 Tax=Ferruginivarius sediminum TaxID=2661937 RepID=A0A369TCN8_9PROT|nr:NnrS family protein [Ferruginivarius sediminum]RDD63048.1 NnrS family protein [Ferruginivarius sediminum]
MSTFETTNHRRGGAFRFALFDVGFRPFFLLGAAWSAVSLALWVTVLRGGLQFADAYPAVMWHAHEMVYGFAAAIVAGFLLTAVPSWTGRPGLKGVGLAALAVLWLAGRAAMLASGTLGVPLVAAVDLAFLAVVFARTAAQVLAGRNFRNLPVAIAPGLLLAGNALVHAEALDIAATATLGGRLGVVTIAMLVALIGGRIIPAFTRNWLSATGRGGPMPAEFGRFDVAVMLLTAATFVAWLAGAQTVLTGVLAVLATAGNLARLLRWQGWRTWREPLLWILHLGYLWLPVGLALMAASALLPAALGPSTALHALTAGLMGTMMLAMMTRATLGHTGRKLSADPATTVIYLAVLAAALLRIAAGLLPSYYLPLVAWSGGAWLGAFALYLLTYTHKLCGPRVDRG